MRTVRLARIAAEAEALRLRRIARRTAFRAVYAVILVVFAVAALTMVHVTGWLYAARNLGPVTAALIVLGVDVVLCIIFGVLAARSSPDRIEQEALQVRQTAVHQIGQGFALMMMLQPVARRARAGGVLGRLLATGIDVVLRR
jgi:hypothetical protein